MLRALIALSLTLPLLASSACGGRAGKAPTMPNGGPIAIMVHLNRGITPDMPPERVQQMNQLCDWMENDLLAILDDVGYAPTRVADPATQAGPGRELLRVTIKNYNAGSKAARMWVGFGAGAATLDSHFELIGEGGATLIAGDPSVASGRDWRNAARKINLQTVEAVNARLSQK